MAKKKNNGILVFLLILLIFMVVGMFVLMMRLSSATENASALAEPAPTESEMTATEPVISFDPSDPTLILVNKEHRVDADYEPEELVELDESLRATNRDPVTQKLAPEAAEAFIALAAGAIEEGLTIKLTSGYRSYAVQEKLYNHYLQEKGEEWTQQYSAPPGASEHHTGLAIDLSCPSISYVLADSFSETEEYRWLQAHAHEYGFIIRYPEGKEDITGYSYEPWHIRYVGKDAAKVITERDITLEEFLRDI